MKPQGENSFFLSLSTLGVAPVLSATQGTCSDWQSWMPNRKAGLERAHNRRVHASKWEVQIQSQALCELFSPHPPRQAPLRTELGVVPEYSQGSEPQINESVILIEQQQHVNRVQNPPMLADE